MKNYKKKILLLLLVSAFMLGLSSCGKKEAPITSLSDLNGKTVSVESGTIFAGDVKSCGKLDDCNIQYALYASDAFALLLSDKVEGYVTDNLGAQTLVRQHPELTILEESIADSYYGIAFRKGSELVDEFNQVLFEMTLDGTISALNDKWLGDDNKVKVIDASVSENLKSSKGTLACLTNSELEPMCYRDSRGQLVGYDIELMLLASHRLGYNVSFTEKIFDDIIPSIYAAQGDLAIAGISITSDRSLQADFSNPYMDVGTVAIVKQSGSKLGAGTFWSLRHSIRRVLIDENRWQALLGGMGITVLLTVSSIIVGTLLGFALCIFDYSKNKLAKFLVRLFNHSVTMLPVCVRLMIWFYIILAGMKGSMNVFAAFLTLSVGFAISVFGCITMSIETNSANQMLLARSIGYSKFQALKHVLLPQAIPTLVDSSNGIVIDQIKCTALVEFIAVQDFQAVLDGISAATYEALIPVVISVIFYIAFEELMCYVVRMISKHLVHDRNDLDYRMKRIMAGKI